MLPTAIRDEEGLVTVVGLHGVLMHVEGDAMQVRRGAKELLNAACAKGRLVVWSQADRDHTSLCLDKLGLDRPPDYVVTSTEWDGARDVGLLGVCTQRVVFIDSCLSAVLQHPQCSIYVPPYDGGSDDALPSLLTDYRHIAPPVQLSHLPYIGASTPVRTPYTTPRKRYALHVCAASLVLALLVDSRALLFTPLICGALSRF